MEPNKHSTARPRSTVRHDTQPHTALPSAVRDEPRRAVNQTQHRRTGKIARLPNEDRELLNIMLRDGGTYPRIIQKLAERGHRLNPKNLSRWHAGGHQDWLQDQAYLEELGLRLDFAGKVVQQSNGAVLDAASLRIAVSQMYTLLLSFDPVILKDKLAANPGAYSRIINSLCKLTSESIRCERRRDFSAVSSSSIPHPSKVPVNVAKCR